MLSDQPFILYAFLDLEYYENIESYQPKAEYRSVVEKIVGEEWSLRARGFWTLCSPPEAQHLRQGWKIHVSAVPWTAIETLERVVPRLAASQTPFKFTSDAMMLHLSLSKNWSRTGAGKFMAIYPRNEEELVTLIDDLHRATADLRGPFILTDRPYKDSKVVFYRYGEHWSTQRVEPNGVATPIIQSPGGEWVPDDRVPYFRLPPWVKDPFTDAATLQKPGERGVVLKDRYRAILALRYTGVGGIYAGEDLETGQAVVIREGRPLLGTTRDRADTFALLQKEARILQKLGPTGLMPQFVDLFQEWEHLFLVQERLVETESLWGYSMGFYYDKPEQSPAESFQALRSTMERIGEGLRTVHQHGIVLRDLTKNNLLCRNDGVIKFIDLEFAYEMDRDDPHLWVQTAGYASPEQLRNERPSFADDYYAFGAVILDVTTYMASGLDLNRPGVLSALRMFLQDLRWPMELYDVIAGLTDPDRASRWTLDRALEALRSAPVPADTTPLFNPGVAVPHRQPPTDELRREIEETVGGIARFIHAKTNSARDDRLWPASAEVFSTNPVGFQHGASGTASFLLRAEGAVPPEALRWIAGHLDTRPCPPGLHVGHAGTALLLLEAGEVEAAQQLLDRTASSPLVHQEPGLYYGAAGWGLAHLHFWHRLREPRFLERAVEAAERLIAGGHRSEAGWSWRPPESAVLGLGEGQSGVALFLLYLHVLDPQPRWLEAASAALDFDIAHCQDLGNQVLWFPRANSAPGEPKSPHLWFGTAGVGAVVARMWAATGEPRYRAFADRCAATLCERFTNKIWTEFGISGFGELLIDMYQLTGDEPYLWNAFFLAEAVLHHRIPKEGGYAFAGQDLFRICCDYGLGSAGIGLFLHRLSRPQTPRILMLDELLPTAVELAPAPWAPAPVLEPA